MTSPNSATAVAAARVSDHDHDAAAQRKSIPLPEPPTGKERWAYSVARERILQEMHALALDGTLRPNAPLPTPREFEAWATDLRRGRLSVAGGFPRWVRLLNEREHPDARRLAEMMLELMRRLMDLELPRPVGPAAPITATKRTGALDVMTEPEVLRALGRRRKITMMPRGIGTGRTLDKHP